MGGRERITEGTTSTQFALMILLHALRLLRSYGRAAGKPSVDEADISFKDVSEDSYYSDAVKWAVVNDITNGTSETTFTLMMNAHERR